MKSPNAKGPTTPRQRIKDPGKTIGRLLSYVTHGYTGLFILVLACILVSALVGVASSLFLRTLIDDYVTPLMKQAAPDFSGLARVVILMAGLYVVGVLATWLYNRFMPLVSHGVMKDIRDEMFGRMQTLPVRYFDANTYGDVMSRYTNDTDTLRQMLTQSLPQMFSSIVSVIMVLCAMLASSLWLTLIVAVCTGVMLLLTKLITGKAGIHFIRQQQFLGELNGYIEEMISGQKVIKVFNHEKEAEKGFDRRNDELTEQASKANTYANILMPVIFNMGNLQYVLIAMAGGVLAISGVGGLTLGMIAAFLQLSKSFTGPIGQMSQQINSVIMALAGAERIFGLMDAEPEQDDGYVTLVNARHAAGSTAERPILEEAAAHTGMWAWKHPHHDGTLTYTPLAGDVQIADVGFSYVEGKPVLHDVSISATSGQKVAFVGATGAGKTTITNLITRFYDIADGKIRYDGININKIRKQDLRQSLGIVLQDVNLFTGTVMENIRYGKLDATDEEVYTAARLANADDFIRRLPEGYDTMLCGDGSDLSQGQRQLISIARVAIADPPVMILDEATSSIDTRTEAIVQAGMDRLMQGRTTFVIAHRLSTVQNADVIIVLAGGRVIERGTHEELIAQKGTYWQLYTGAFELE